MGLKENVSFLLSPVSEQTFAITFRKVTTVIKRSVRQFINQYKVSAELLTKLKLEIEMINH